MRDISPTPNITVTIGGQLRVYYAFVTTAGPELDGPTTVTLYASTLTELSGFATDPIRHDSVHGQALARLVLIDLKALTWHRAKYREEQCICAPVDPILVSQKALQHWLWQRLQAPNASHGHA
jgi:hypothetical protein